MAVTNDFSGQFFVESLTMFEVSSTRNLMFHLRPFGVLLAGLLPLASTANADRLEIEQVLDVVPVWSGHPVRFALLTDGKRQFVAFYDAARQMTVGSRTVDSDQWEFVRLPSKVGWDSHNYVTMALDDRGYLHLSGNMHCVPLIYFRTTRPYDVNSFRRIESMVGRNESRCTYPRFLRGSGGELIFVYRDGGSGNGSRYFNVFRPETRTWQRLFDEPLFSGQGKMNAYFQGPVRDGQGTFHVCWVWRDTPDCETNHHLSYVRSRDLMGWETSHGKPLVLPITIDNAEVVDPVLPGGGLLNGNTKIGFDSKGRVIISYHKYDADGKTQLYNARREQGGWKIYRTSDWDYRWDFHGRGSIRFEIGMGAVTLEPDGTLSQSYRHAKHGSGNWLLDEATLKPIDRAPRREALPKEISRLESTRAEMGVHTAADLGKSDPSGVRYILRWETLPSNRDRARAEGPPEPSMLRVYKLTGASSFHTAR